MKRSDIPEIVNIVKRTLGIIDSKKAKKDLLDQSKKLYVQGGNFVAEVQGKVVGVIGYWRLNHHPRSVVWLDWFVVDKTYQGKGLGTILLSTVVKRLQKKGIRMICCEKSSKDIISDKFYARHKFVEHGRIKHYWEDGGDLILLVKSLPT